MFVVLLCFCLIIRMRRGDEVKNARLLFCLVLFFCLIRRKRRRGLKCLLFCLVLFFGAEQKRNKLLFLLKLF